jgi:hypothetical protein
MDQTPYLKTSFMKTIYKYRFLPFIITAVILISVLVIKYIFDKKSVFNFPMGDMLLMSSTLTYIALGYWFSLGVSAKVQKRAYNKNTPDQDH